MMKAHHLQFKPLKASVATMHNEKRQNFLKHNMHTMDSRQGGMMILNLISFVYCYWERPRNSDGQGKGSNGTA